MIGAVGLDVFIDSEVSRTDFGKIDFNLPRHLSSWRTSGPLLMANDLSLSSHVSTAPVPELFCFQDRPSPIILSHIFQTLRSRKSGARFHIQASLP